MNNITFNNNNNININSENEQTREDIKKQNQYDKKEINGNYDKKKNLIFGIILYIKFAVGKKIVN